MTDQAELEAVARAIREANDGADELDWFFPDARAAIAALDAHRLAPFEYYSGPLPDDDSPLRCVYESGIQYAVNLLAKDLGVTDYDVCDGTEEFDGDLSGTMQNIIAAALPADENGDRVYLSEASVLILAQKAEIERLEARLLEVGLEREQDGLKFLAEVKRAEKAEAENERLRKRCESLWDDRSALDAECDRLRARQTLGGCHE